MTSYIISLNGAFSPFLFKIEIIKPINKIVENYSNQTALPLTGNLGYKQMTLQFHSGSLYHWEWQHHLLDFLDQDMLFLKTKKVQYYINFDFVHQMYDKQIPVYTRMQQLI